jgi:transcriptional regulator with PAS, ATPase and Fis domain
MAKSDVQQVKQRYGIIGNSAELLRAIDIAIQVAPTDLSVLITGESGVGKEFFPQIIHQNSPRKHQSYIAVNCGAIPEGTIDSELFGHEKGSFTGALSDRKGYFEGVDGGTIFLDEVGELPFPTQARLLRVLESGEFIKVGSSKVLKTNVRIVAATNLNMEQAIADGRFREDLYYRLNSVPIHVPPLRDRGDDIYLLFRKFAADFAEKYRMPAITLSDEARRLLVGYRFPGNIRQLKNITEQISIIETSRDITFEALKSYLPNYNQQRLPALLEKTKDERTFGSEREILYQVLFDMRKEMHELKQLVHDIMSQAEADSSNVNVYKASESIIKTPANPISTIQIRPQEAEENTQYTEEYEEESLSLSDVERELIRKALEKYKGKRGPASRELEISERTLYRKIKEYDLEK